ncbi:MAG: hypothetical protein F4Y73_03515 [Gemmatimonadetes bacterium]|nr:hypothetical protein [Gemmatimonadota bacterium]
MLLSLGCEASRAPGSFLSVNLFPDAGGERTVRAADYETLWTYGPGDTVLASAVALDAFSNGDAAVLDGRSQRVHRIGPGGVVWSWGRTGQGPGELRNVRAMAVNDREEVVLADSGNRRLLWISGSGSLLRETPLPAPGQGASGTVNGIVPLADGGYILDSMAPEPWLRVSEAGEPVAVVSSPWEPLGDMHPLQRYGNVTRAHGNLWVFGFALGNGFFLFDDRSSRGAYPYIEHSDFPAVVVTRRPNGNVRLSYPVRPTPAAQDLAVRADTLLVLVNNRALDRYDLTTGSYVETTVLPRPVHRVAVSGDGLLVIEADELFPTVASVRRRAAPWQSPSPPFPTTAPLRPAHRH